MLYSFLNGSEMSVQRSLEGFTIFPEKNQKTLLSIKKFVVLIKLVTLTAVFNTSFRAGVRALGSSARHRRKRFTMHHQRNDYQDISSG
jgi:hypothetical protein